MKKRVLATMLLLGILLSGCSVDRDSSSSLDESEISQSSSTGESVVAERLSKEELMKLREYAISFSELFNNPFSSVDELDYQMIGINSLYWIATTENHGDFETNDAGYPYIPKSLLQSFVWEHFGIDDYECPVSDNPNILPQYDSNKKAYLFGAAREGSTVIVSILDETISGQNVTYTMKFETPNIETREIMETQNMEYKFQIISTTDGYVLRAISAVKF